MDIERHVYTSTLCIRVLGIRQRREGWGGGGRRGGGLGRGILPPGSRCYVCMWCVTLLLVCVTQADEPTISIYQTV